MQSSHERDHSRYSYPYAVYIFSGDAQRMKQHQGRCWDLYGLWTHSTSPVVQYICEEGSSSPAERLGLELLGQCIPQSMSRGHRRHGRGRWLVIFNDGAVLEPSLTQPDGLAPIKCFIKELPMESPFVKFKSDRATHRSRSPERRLREDTHERRVPVDRPVIPHERRVPVDRRDDRASRSPERPLQWYTTSRGEETLRSIYNQCTRAFPAPASKVEMSRDSIHHNMQLTIQHNQKTYSIHFPDNFPQSSAHVVISSIFANRKISAKTTEEILRTIKSDCRCYKCSSSRF
ncbi:uncharacterized protein LOC114517854 [Dendronephthya gigantea]|uniref:uncharacterized protein LOC114517854 n=1 Tax=Dendronephthya gigantea TaxID=151771 RepID=UPI00106D3EA3|nr:uncharacterized protein LOC114517854 [Dendronephthya gigantea]